MTNKAFNLKNMKETIINYSGIQSEFDKIWETFYQMACLDFINRETWIKFYEWGKDIVIEDDKAVRVLFDKNGNETRETVWVYNPKTRYKA